MFSTLDGWQWLSENYKLNNEFFGEKSSWTSATMNGISFNNCFVLGANADGLYLSMIFLFRFGHSPLLIPWSEVTIGKRKFLFSDKAVIEFKKTPGIILTVSEELFSNFRSFVKQED
ncbi:hypothetical protein V6Z05_19475 [Leptospira venezuelensis]|uniref:hypothetical protein n=1 Tax=Leptospira venezuelensis TaxID=1958811 RepID=UPI0012FF7370|nr:hypothetical protein [Leptospira venezuelensis]